MPRHARKLSESKIYHVILRGNNRQHIFIDHEDKERIISTIGIKKEEDRYQIYAYCVLDNHIHMVVKEGKDNLSRVIKRIATSYAFYFNQKYKRSGHVFQDRYKSENIENEKYLLEVIRYIHQNPMKAGIGVTESYKWSSYQEYLLKEPGIVKTDEILGIFSSDREKAVWEFIKFNQDKTEEFYIDVPEEKTTEEGEIKWIIEGYLREKRVKKKDLGGQGNRPLREELIKILQEKTGLSLRKIAEELGLNREMVRRAAVSREPSP